MAKLHTFLAGAKHCTVSAQGDAVSVHPCTGRVQLQLTWRHRKAPNSGYTQYLRVWGRGRANGTPLNQRAKYGLTCAPVAPRAVELFLERGSAASPYIGILEIAAYDEYNPDNMWDWSVKDTLDWYDIIYVVAGEDQYAARRVANDLASRPVPRSP